MHHAVSALVSTLAVALIAIAGLAHAAPADCTIARCAYLPLIAADRSPTIAPTTTPTQLPPSFNSCQDDPNASFAPSYPIRIVIVLKASVPEVVRLQNTSAQTIELTGWQMCSIKGNQQHNGIAGTLAPGELKDFPYTGAGPIWNNSEQDNGALYDPAGHLVSYWLDQ